MMYENKTFHEFSFYQEMSSIFQQNSLWIIILDSSRRNKNILSKDRLFLWLNL